MTSRSCLLLLALALATSGTSAVTCEDVQLSGPYAPGRLKKCVGGLDVRRTTDPNSCPDGWKIWAPETREDFLTVIDSGVLPVRNPHFIVDVTRDSNGCGTDCRSALNSNNPNAMSWHTSNGEPFWLRDTDYHEPNGNYNANCYLYISSWSNVDDIRYDDSSCNAHSTDYLCQPILKVNCENRTNDIEGPCKNETAIFKHSNCTSGVCEAGDYLMFKGATTIDECRQVCDHGRDYKPVPTGLREEVFGFRTSGFKTAEQLEAYPKVLDRMVDTVDYPSTSGTFSGYDRSNSFYSRWTGWLDIKLPGDYTFFTTSDDGSRMFLEGNEIIDNGGWHGMRERSGTVTLTEGLHHIRVEMYEGSGGAGMLFKWQGPATNGAKEIVPKEAFGSPGGEQFYLEGLFGNAGPCMAYSFSAQKECIIYTSCSTVGSGSTCSADLSFLGPLDGFKTCQLSPTGPPAGNSSAATPAPTPAPLEFAQV